MKRSWKTTLGGSLASVGTLLWGAPVALAVFDKALIDPWMLKSCVVGGLLMSALGALFTGLFGRDNSVSSDEVKSIRERTGNTDQFKPPTT
jgi:hypothetical protein